MPRAEPNRSAYCASRHLLRNLDDAGELRRNPLAQSFFASASPRRRDPLAERDALDRIRTVVHRALASCDTVAVAARAQADAGRMRAALLRCELDRQPLAVVAPQLSLSERQLRRERRAAHQAFSEAFTRSALEPLPATVSVDLATLRLSEASELHELGQSRLARAACAELTAAAPRSEHGIEAYCLIAEIELDALRWDAAAKAVGEARALLTQHTAGFAAEAAIAASERVDFTEWLVSWRRGSLAGLNAPAPAITLPAAATRDRTEPGRALLVRALAAYAAQRWEIGDGTRGRAAIARAQALVASLHSFRAKERFAVLYADAQLFSLRSPVGADAEKFAALEQLARAKGHLRTHLGARAERIGSGVTTARGARIADAVLGPFGAAERGSLTGTLASAALIVAQCERNRQRATAAAMLVGQLSPPRSGIALLARCMRMQHAHDLGRYDETWTLAHDLRADAELAGNGRVRGAANRILAATALKQRRPQTAKRFIDEALPLLAHFGTWYAFTQACDVERRLLGAARGRTGAYLPANFAGVVSR